MIKLSVLKKEQHFTGFRCSGHAGFAESGSDIVCAAVSSVAEFIAAYFSRFYPDTTQVSVKDNQALIEMHCKDHNSELDRQMETLITFADSLADQYPENFSYDILEV